MPVPVQHNSSEHAAELSERTKKVAKKNEVEVTNKLRRQNWINLC
jgi:hypothetical protein